VRRAVAAEQLDGLGLGLHGADLRRRDLDLLAEHVAGRHRGRGHHLVHRLADRAELELGQLAARLDAVGVLAHHGGREPPRALDGEHEQVAARDAVDVRDVGGDRR
jgi:hypothetical protein